MGRKIPAKKHRGVKDPLAQQAKRWQILKGKINAPPKDPDEQPVPRSLIRLFGLEDPKTKDKEKQKKRNIKNNPSSNSVGRKKGRNPVAQLRRLPGESGRSFSLRINGAVRALNDSAEELHYPVDMEDDDDVKGSRMEEQRRRRERKRRRQPTAGAGAGTGDGDGASAKLTRGQRLTLKKKEKKLKQEEVTRTEAREVMYDRVGFGEVAHAPPALTLNTRNRAKLDGAPRPGRRELLLTRMLAPAKAAAAPVPVAEQLRRERARQDAVDAYRALKRRKQPPPTAKI